MPLSPVELKALYTWAATSKSHPDILFIKKIGGYKDLILSWSKRINLVSKNDLGKIIENHILDSLGPATLIPAHGDLIDIGSGAGFPGIPLALIFPTLSVTLLESIHKRILFLSAAKQELDLSNITIFEGRLENLSIEKKYDIATVRALPKWESHLPQIKKLLNPEGKVIYYKYRGVYEQIDP